MRITAVLLPLFILSACRATVPMRQHEEALQEIAALREAWSDLETRWQEAEALAAKCDQRVRAFENAFKASAAKSKTVNRSGK